MEQAIEPISFDWRGASAATGLSADMIMRAVRAGDLVAHYPVIDGRTVAKPLILANDLRAWIASGPTERRP